MTMTSPQNSRSAVRTGVGVVRIVAALTLLVALVFQIVEKVANNDMVPQEYFSYFTIQSSMIAFVVLFTGGLMALRRPTDTVLYTTMRVSVLAYGVVTAVVYNLLLRNIPDQGFVSTPWPGEIMHVWIPILIVLDWLLSPGRPALRWTALRIVVVYPLAWLAFTLLRGAATAWYPYPFLEPATGWLSVGAYIVGVAAFIVGVAALGIAWGHRGPRAPRVTQPV